MDRTTSNKIGNEATTPHNHFPHSMQNFAEGKTCLRGSLAYEYTCIREGKGIVEAIHKLAMVKDHVK